MSKQTLKMDDGSIKSYFSELYSIIKESGFRYSDKSKHRICKLLEKISEKSEMSFENKDIVTFKAKI